MLVHAIYLNLREQNESRVLLKLGQFSETQIPKFVNFLLLILICVGLFSRLKSEHGESLFSQFIYEIGFYQ
jgi:hypothetical protein